ncbi:hypothetical protein F2P79_005271 [Pimephales promelas]|nr:hypothetical protein F2P79_005271 [Pimephales promelas]
MQTKTNEYILWGNMGTIQLSVPQLSSHYFHHFSTFQTKLCIQGSPVLRCGGFSTMCCWVRAQSGCQIPLEALGSLKPAGTGSRTKIHPWLCVSVSEEMCKGGSVSRQLPFDWLTASNNLEI